MGRWSAGISPPATNGGGRWGTSAAWNAWCTGPMERRSPAVGMAGCSVGRILPLPANWAPSTSGCSGPTIARSGARWRASSTAASCPSITGRAKYSAASAVAGLTIGALIASGPVPVTARGAGTSIAGNAVGPGVVLDLGRHMDRVLAVDPDAATATVQPGVVQEDLQRAAAPHGLRFGPDPSSSSRCTIGGMIGNNACGTRALGYGRTSDNLLGLRAITGSGAPWDAPAVRDGLSAVTRAGLATIRTVSGLPSRSRRKPSR